MLKITFDSNCLFLLDEKKPETAFVRRLIKYHNQGKITVQIPLIVAYENRVGDCHGVPLDRYSDSWRNLERELRQRIKRHGFDRDPAYLPRYAIVVEPEPYVSENLYVVGEDTIALFKKVQAIIHPNINFEEMLQAARIKLPDAEFAPDWRSDFNDIHICLNHILSKADFLLSNDEHIYGKATKLEHLGARRVLSFSRDDQKILREAIEGVQTFTKNKGK